MRAAGRAHEFDPRDASVLIHADATDLAHLLDDGRVDAREEPFGQIYGVKFVGVHRRYLRPYTRRFGSINVRSSV